MTVSKVPNRLINEKSPYLLQHAYNPVAWFPWGDEAFNKAKTENKPIFLSIGYSTCHWCHVMAHESFEDDEVAQFINQHFIAIKLDKEERPDVDAIYMMACQMMTGQGGWPLTVIMTPEQQPFFVGTYFPKQTRYGMPGLLDILSEITKKWREDPGSLIAVGGEITEALNRHYQQGDKTVELPSFDLQVNNEAFNELKAMPDEAYTAFLRSFDPRWGGFGRQPKFPSPHQLLFLLRYHHFAKADKALSMVEKTLAQMYRGGIFDHVDYGFSRYSTDASWLVPHFEKMLYDNALLTIAYLEAYQITGKSLYKLVAVKTIDYVLREMRHEKGGFFSAQDADSEGVEGKYYVFTPEEIIGVLGQEEGNFFNKYYDVTAEGNFEGKSIVNLLENPKALQEDSTTQALLAGMQQKLSAYRRQRSYLHKDDKVLTSWNGLMLVALAKAYEVLGEQVYLEAALQALDFIKAELVDAEGDLLVRWRDGEANGKGLLDDYVFLIWALLALYETSYNIDYLEEALAWNEKLVEYFWDESSGGFYLNRLDQENLICRPKENYDGAIPSGNSLAAYNLLRLAKLTGQPKLEKLAAQQLSYVSDKAAAYPAGHSFYLIALSQVVYPSRELVICLDSQEQLPKVMAILQQRFIPNTVVLIKTPENQDRLSKLAPFTESYELAGESARFYICQNHSCSAPFSDLTELEKILSKG